MGTDADAIVQDTRITQRITREIVIIIINVVQNVENRCSLPLVVTLQSTRQNPKKRLEYGEIYLTS